MRDLFVTELVRNMLGPRNGINEILDDRHKPISEYITGILSPVDDDQKDNIRDNIIGGNMPSIQSSKFEGDEDGDGLTGTMLNPSLNPEKISSAMGISFQTESSSVPKLNVCITWARYIPDSSKEPNWKRAPRFSLLELSNEGDSTIHIDAAGKKSDESKAEISLYSKIRPLGDGKFFVNFFVVNKIKINDDKQIPKFYIFQPQIRITCGDKTSVIPMSESSEQDNKSFDEFHFRKRKFFARGHMTSAVWKDIDPEIIPDDLKEEFAESIKHPPFKWIDSEVVPQESVEKFLKPDIRTEYIPIYSIPSPDIEWRGDENEKPVLHAKDLSEAWDREKLEGFLSPIISQYSKWIKNLDSVKNGKNDQLVDSIIKECNLVLSRIGDGITMLLDDEDARLAFCFANKAIDIQSVWGRGEGMRFRPFQLAFILMSLESILNPSSKYRNVCDLLWVPTGTGKTEAYLVLVAMAMVYRRIQELKTGKPGAGVTVMSRYTLRLLSIQQFRRSLSLFAAAELLRNTNLPQRNKIGWRPDGYTNNDNFIWGTTPFSVGLWVGGGVTPNSLTDIQFMKNQKFVKKFAALTLLKKNPRFRGEGEPAQVLECPACRNILAVPERGLSEKMEHEINWIVKTSSQKDELNSVKKDELKKYNFDITEIEFSNLENTDYKTMRIKFQTKLNAEPQAIYFLWSDILKKFNDKGIKLELQCTSPSRPGYFYKTYLNQKNRLVEYDFEIYCTKKGCPLETDWIGGSPMGGINGTIPDPNSVSNSFDSIALNDGNRLIAVQPCFKKSENVSDRIPIPGLTVDDQVYKTAPTMIVATVDKFARLPYQPQAGILFGNAEFYHLLHGYYRLTRNEHPKPTGRNQMLYQQLEIGDRHLPPSFIIQDELHLLDGPLGSMSGIYESCIDFLSNATGNNLKYIASTATIKRGADQVRSLFVRDLQVFPPNGTDVDDRFFIWESEKHQLLESNPGRLYLGVMAPGKGALTPIVRIWSRLAQTAFENTGNPEIDRFWTVIGYFNAVRELAGARALYRQDIPDWLRHLSPNSPRDLAEDKVYELSGRTSSNDLPSILDLLNKKHPDAADGLFTTSMFGTGIDVPRMGLMIVNGQPKTTSSYIQSTGRVGRSKGALVVSFYRASRPRDMSHYEFFMRNHRQLHRTVEPPSVFPFSSGTVERSLGPIVVGILRNMRNPNTNWSASNSAIRMSQDYGNPEMQHLANYLESRSRNQPKNRSPIQGKIQDDANAAIERWRDVALNVQNLEYVEYDKAENSVVLGDPRHEKDDNVETVFHNAPQSLRELEEETGFQT